MKIPKIQWYKDEYGRYIGEIDLCKLGVNKSIHLFYEDKVLLIGDTDVGYNPLYEKKFSCFLAAKLSSLNCVKEVLKIMVRKELEMKEHHAKKAALLASLVENK